MCKNAIPTFNPPNQRLQINLLWTRVSLTGLTSLSWLPDVKLVLSLWKCIYLFMYFTKKVYVAFLSSLQGNMAGTVAAYIVLPGGFLLSVLLQSRETFGNVMLIMFFLISLLSRPFSKHMAELCCSAALSGYID